ncbi:MULTISPECIES: non-ribosomal peptide synthetase [unclassified Streptomyces]|uniref:non-ribosomal peptide synthetase n=1 Tax=unclassified Streptomyces TaxID=2593676 RepID=UPI000881CE87|nr:MULTISPECIES: non-ribosomal peptide synthetase [unclassified Streptomyces]PBC86839.1 amino acid adenylation domain-containing protein [Streptomyces sp. 2321.6]SDQ70647.1 amino acid adenylation domain-containing protein [Streptomyces sp. KS_16]SEE11065.1 amino acid adenylation domain-containing protein [Streptomyces sp. 2133.1]SNC74015.1 amino acid adenylation domain-containing protein [Streptomyces sp. 2114.4]
MTQPMTARTPAPTTASGARLPAPQGSLSIARGAAPATEGTSGVLSRFEEWTRRSPEAPAVIDGAHRWTYRDIDAAADEAARALRDRVRPGDLVGVCLDRSAALVATAVALARIGAVYLPLGPRPGERRTEAVTEDLNVVCLIGDPEVLPPRHRSAEHLPLALPGEGANATATVVAAFADPGATARSAPPGAFYAVLTSGSTGRPKAVAVGEPALGGVLDWYRATSGLAPGDRQSLLIGVAFDPHLMELWAGLTSGAALVPAPDEVRWDPAVLADWWRESAVTAVVSATPMVEPLLEQPWPQDLTMRHLFVGGDRMRRRPGKDVTCTVHNAYGPAEATVVSTVYAMHGTDGAAGTESAPPIGRPLPGVTVVVADADGRPVARGAEGELLIGGSGLALGYLDPGLTARRFLAVPEGVELPGVERLYRTGDRVRMPDDGALEFLGRLDDQVKISGVRIEPAEVEAAFERDPAVRSAVVTAPRTADGHTRLVAYVRPAAGAALTADALLPAVRAWLPEQAVPSDVRIVDSFPLDANGKVDRAELARQAAAGAPRPGDAPADGGGPAGTTPGERLVLSAVGDLLARSEISLGESFTGAGGTSLLAARLLTVIEKESGVRLRAPELLRQPDLRAVAQLVDTRLAARQPAGA